MKIALLGYGKMGKVIEKIALERGHQIVLKKGSNDTYEGLLNADVAIDFSIPSVAVANISECLHNTIPVVSGTTGWLADYDKMVALCNEKNGSFIYGSNFSLGVNIFFELNDYLAKIMKNLTQYSVSMEEIHHTQKLDAPSGTAITLAEGIIENLDRKSGWHLETENNSSDIAIKAIREGQVPGIHTIRYESSVDSIEITHDAKSREGFALGAVVAAEFTAGKKGMLGMQDLLKF